MNGKIYKIIHNQSNIVYVGSTTGELKLRWNKHKNQYKQWIKGNHSNVSIFKYFEQFGIENFQMILIKDYDICDKQHLKVFEQLWIAKLKAINKNNAFYIKFLHNRARGDKYNEKARIRACKYYNDNKEKVLVKNKKRYEANKDTINEKRKDAYKNDNEKVLMRNKIWRDNNKDAINEKRRIQYQNNKDAIHNRNKDSYQKNKDKHTIMITCECGTELQKRRLSTHLKSKKHLNFTK